MKRDKLIVDSRGRCWVSSVNGEKNFPLGKHGCNLKIGDKVVLCDGSEWIIDSTPVVKELTHRDVLVEIEIKQNEKTD